MFGVMRLVNRPRDSSFWRLPGLLLTIHSASAARGEQGGAMRIPVRLLLQRGVLNFVARDPPFAGGHLRMATACRTVLEAFSAIRVRLRPGLEPASWRVGSPLRAAMFTAAAAFCATLA
ncbi:hypothetical protein IC580_04175 [Cupriavidus sp. ISTL7]|nr:hypothetical protein IC580_04175 [Cupriavidus sp. ISTL7]